MLLLEFLKNYNKHPVIGSMGWQLSLNVSRTAFAIISSALLTRYFGPEDYGFYSFILAILSIFTLFSRAGSDSVAVKLFTQNPDERNKIFGAVLTWRLINWLIGFIILLAITLVLHDTKYWYALILYSFLLFNPIDAIDHYFSSTYKNKFSLQARLIVETTAIVVKIYLVLNNYPLSYFIWALGIQNIIYGFILLLFYKYTQKEYPRPKFTKLYFLDIAKKSIPLFFATLMIMMYLRVDQIMISYLAGDIELGYYSAPSQITINIFCLSIFFVQPMQVKFLELGIDNKNYYKWLQYYLHIITRAAFMIALLGTLLAPFVIPLLFGSEFTPSIPILMIQIWTCIFSFQEIVRNREIINNHKTSYNLISAFAGLVTNIILNLFLIPEYGGVGAAIATLISQFTAAYLVSWAVKDLRPIAKMQTHALLFKKLETPQNA